MSEPIKAEYSLPKDRYGRTSRLVIEREGGAAFWSIVSDAVSQQDEGEHIRSLTTAQLIEIGEIAAKVGKGR